METFNKNEEEVKKFNLKDARHLEPESYYGMIEYKLHVNDILGTHRYEQIKSQMKFRLHQGEGKAVYNVGWYDDGHPHGVEYDILIQSLQILYTITEDLGGTIQSIKLRKGKHGYCAVVFLTHDDLCHDLLPPAADEHF